MNRTQLEIGSVVVSNMGRDKDGFFMVVGLLDEDYVLISDGCTRKLSKPKKKNIRHLIFGGIVLESIAVKMKENKKVFDSELKSALRQYSEHRVEQQQQPKKN